MLWSSNIFLNKTSWWQFYASQKERYKAESWIKGVTFRLKYEYLLPWQNDMHMEIHAFPGTSWQRRGVKLQATRVCVTSPSKPIRNLGKLRFTFLLTCLAFTCVFRFAIYYSKHWWWPILSQRSCAAFYLRRLLYTQAANSPAAKNSPNGSEKWVAFHFEKSKWCVCVTSYEVTNDENMKAFQKYITEGN